MLIILPFFNFLLIEPLVSCSIILSRISMRLARIQLPESFILFKMLIPAIPSSLQLHPHVKKKVSRLVIFLNDTSCQKDTEDHVTTGIGGQSYTEKIYFFFFS